MNPFDWRGPEFLLFYTTFGSVVLALQYFLQRTVEPQKDTPTALTDPYTIAYLRDGTKAAGQVAVLSLLDRELLKTEEQRVVPASNVSTENVTNPIEGSVLAASQLRLMAHEVCKYPGLEMACQPNVSALRSAGLIPNLGSFIGRGVICALTIAVLLDVSVTKIWLALSRGHTNILFLILLTIVVSGCSLLIALRRRTHHGDRMLTSLRGLCNGLRGRADDFRPGEQTGEVMLLAAVFGLSAVPGRILPLASSFFARPPREYSASGDGSSCGGGGCGGGGCGGGCGGCGGCGS